MKQELHTVLTTYENYFFAAQICLSFSIIAMELKSHISIFCGSSPDAIAVQHADGAGALHERCMKATLLLVTTCTTTITSVKKFERQTSSASF
jgi:hypothetical protein